MALIISISGIRGIVGSELNHLNTMTFTSALIKVCKIKRLVMARDTRASGLYLRDIVSGTALALGVTVIDLGIVPTPTAAMAVKRHKADAAILITASHNPIQWNALKFLNGKGEFISQNTLNDLQKEVKTSTCAVEYDKIGKSITDNNAVNEHIQSIINLPYISPQTIKNSHFRVAYNGINGAGAYAIPDLLKRLGVETLILEHCKPDGNFPHNPEPIKENISYFTETVIKNQCDIGFITDPDSDRLAIVTNKGQIFGEENTQVLATDFILKHKKGDVVTNISSSVMIDFVSHRHNQKVFRTAVGERNVIEGMKRHNAIIGGEGSGGVINPDLHYGRDALVAISMILQWLATSDLSIDDYLNSLPVLHIIKEKETLRTSQNQFKKKALIEKLEKAYPSAILTTLDGIHLRFVDSLDGLRWILIRLSNTEPIIRIVAEGETKSTIRRHIKYIKDLIKPC